jgi:hypothetical protein
MVCVLSVSDTGRNFLVSTTGIISGASMIEGLLIGGMSKATNRGKDAGI